MAGTVRVRLHWSDGRVETVREPIDTQATTLVRTSSDRCSHYFEVTKEIDREGFVIAREVPTAS